MFDSDVQNTPVLHYLVYLAEITNLQQKLKNRLLIVSLI